MMQRVRLDTAVTSTLCRAVVHIIKVCAAVPIQAGFARKAVLVGLSVPTDKLCHLQLIGNSMCATVSSRTMLCYAASCAGTL